MAEYALPGSKLLGEKIAKEFANGINTVMLENHGVVIGSDDLFKAFMTFETLDYCARLEINARSLGKTPHGLSDKHMAMYELQDSPRDGRVRPAHPLKRRARRPRRDVQAHPQSV